MQVEGKLAQLRYQSLLCLCSTMKHSAVGGKELDV